MASWKLTPATLQDSGLDYIALGHCHQLTEYRFAPGSAAAYCGALEGVRFAPGDLGRKSLLSSRWGYRLRGCGLETDPNGSLRFCGVNH